MPQIQMPDGQVVDMPDNPTPDQLARLKAVQATNPKSSTPASGKPSSMSQADYMKAVDAAKDTETKPSESSPSSAAGVDAALSAVGIGPGLGEAALNTGSGMIAKPLSDIAGLAATAKEAIAPGDDPTMPSKFKEDVQQRLTYDPKTALGSAVAGYNPLALLGKGIDYGANAAGDVVAA